MEGTRCECLHVRLKSSKESRVETRGCIIEIFANKSQFCPVAAYKRYIGLNKGGRQDSPAFREPTGWAYKHSGMYIY